MLEQLKSASVLITGATGLIGKNLVWYLHQNAPGCRMIAVVRSLEKAKYAFGEECESWLRLIRADVAEPLTMEAPIDYIIHAASMTASRDFVEKPVDTILTAVNGTRNMLELARQKQAKGFIFLSTMEIYGAPTTEGKVAEDAACNIDSMNARASYPESKRLCESLCTAYHTQYGVPAKVIRLAQTIGPGIDYADNRVFAEFARCAIEHRDIVLHTKGLTKRSYISTNDAVQAILTVLLRGASGEAYNASNEATYCSICEMAELAAGMADGSPIAVKIDEKDIKQFGYAPVLKMNLDTAKLSKLGWVPQETLTEMYINLIQFLRQKREEII